MLLHDRSPLRFRTSRHQWDRYSRLVGCRLFMLEIWLDAPPPLVGRIQDGNLGRCVLAVTREDRHITVDSLMDVWPVPLVRDDMKEIQAARLEIEKAFQNLIGPLIDVDHIGEVIEHQWRSAA